jgi:hypothetical protein
MNTLPPSTFEPADEEPLLAVACPWCHGAIAVSAALAGQAAGCPICAGGFIVPLPPPPDFSRPRDELEFDEPPQTMIEADGGLIELRRLAPKERAARRARRNVLMLVSGMAILITIVLTLGRKRRKK